MVHGLHVNLVLFGRSWKITENKKWVDINGQYHKKLCILKFVKSYVQACIINHGLQEALNKGKTENHNPRPLSFFFWVLNPNRTSMEPDTPNSKLEDPVLPKIS